MSAPLWELLAVGLLLLASGIYLARLGLKKWRVLRAAGKLESGSVCGGGTGGCHCSGASPKENPADSCSAGSR